MRTWFAAFLVFAPLAAGAATTYTWPTAAPCTTTLADCVGSAADSDTIRIATNTPIAETINANKAISFVAAPGFQPVFAANHALVVEALTSASASDATVTIDGLTFLGGAVLVITDGRNLNATLRHLDISGPSEPDGIFIGYAATGTVDFSISSNRVRPANGNGITVAPFYSPSATSTSNSVIGTIHDNRVSGADTAIDVETTGTSKVQIYSNQVTGDDGTGIGIKLDAATTSLNAVIVNNAVVANECEAGIFVQQTTDQPITNNIQLLNNTVSGCSSGVVALVTNPVGYVANNIVSGNSEYGFYFLDSIANDYNLAYGNAANNFIPGPHTITADPRFVPGGARLSAGSPAIDAADTSALRNILKATADFPAIPEIDADGSRRFKGSQNLADIGAYEFGDHGLTTTVTSSNGGAITDPLLTSTSYPQLIQNPFADTYVANTYDPSATGLTFNGTHFIVANENGSAVTPNSRYDIFSPSRGNGAFSHTSLTTNIVGPLSQLNDDYINGHAERIVLATHLALPLFAHPFGLTYISPNWFLIQDDAGGNDFPQDLTFNIYAQDPSFTAFKWSSASAVGDDAIIDHPLLNDEPCGHVFVSGDFIDAHPVEVAYIVNRWAIVNLDTAPMPKNATFSVVIDEAATDFCKYDHIFHNAFEQFD